MCDTCNIPTGSGRSDQLIGRPLVTVQQKLVDALYLSTDASNAPKIDDAQTARTKEMAKT
jgi:hypothetical protein